MEKIIRKVSEIGNGAHIFAPKEWVGEEVIITRIPRKNAKEEIVKLLYPYLDKIISVLLYGSYARNEQDKDSDMDIFIVSKEKFKIKSPNKDIIIVPEDRMENAKKINPILFYSMIQEAMPIINSSYLEILKKEKIRLSCFREFLEDTKRAIKSDEEIMGLDERLKSKMASESVIYSLILRLRGIFIVNLLLRNKKYSKKIFEAWLAENSGADYDKVYKIYRSVRDSKKTKEEVPIKQAQSLIELLKKETKKLEDEAKKGAEKRH